MKPHQQRVIDEKTELDDKISRLSPFLEGETFKTLSEAEQVRLKIQLSIMKVYSNILEERIEHFPQE